MQQELRTAAETVEQSPSQASWTFGPADAGIAAGLLILCLGISIPVAVRLNGAARELDHDTVAAGNRIRMMHATARFTEERREAMAAFRMEAKRYTDEVQAKPQVPWTAVATEFSRVRPDGVWITKLSAAGPRFTIQLAATKPELASDYLSALQHSPVVEFATQPMSAAAGNTFQVVGRLAGE